MNRKMAFVVLALVVSASAAASKNDDALLQAALMTSSWGKNDDKPVVRASIEILKNGKAIHRSELSMHVGLPSTISQETSIGYVSMCRGSSLGERDLEGSSLQTGFYGSINPIRVSRAGVLTMMVSVRYSELVSMKAVRSNGCTIDVPSVKTFYSSAHLQVRPGAAVALPNFDGENQYSVVVRGL